MTTFPLPQIVIDTSVLVAGLRSRRGFAFELLNMVGQGRFDINLSVPLVLEYESVLVNMLPELRLSRASIHAIIDYHCQVGRHHSIFFLWRPYLNDPKDEMVLELAVKAECDYIVTYNARDFTGVTAFGIEAVGPREFLARIQEQP
jgi:putative PIN family toxin of toxin-antitoxin system